ncbi:hypothetical protein [Acuticoccus sediminis]|uniref:hypothetical protein n=1 Tax=Acuticoccus sediminis TaxID=2184697 RepID=UPI001CFEBC59|nr:hypothetical protein [Acuticoccus sediminis]
MTLDADAIAAPVHATARHRRRRSDTLGAILRQFRVEVLPTAVKKSRARQTHAQATLRRLLESHGPDHTRDVLTAILESEGNDNALLAPILTAMSILLRTHQKWWRDGASTWLEVLDGIDLLSLHAAVRSNLAAVPADKAIAAHLHVELARAFGAGVDWRRAA